jgi:hypothetical protein
MSTNAKTPEHHRWSGHRFFAEPALSGVKGPQNDKLFGDELGCQFFGAMSKWWHVSTRGMPVPNQARWIPDYQCRG